jgi:hypothetical protein
VLLAASQVGAVSWVFLPACAVVLPQNGLLPVATHSVWHDEGCPARACSLLACAFFGLTHLPVQQLAQALKQPKAPTGPWRSQVKAGDAYVQSTAARKRKREAAAVAAATAVKVAYVDYGGLVDWGDAMTTMLTRQEEYDDDTLLEMDRARRT